VSGVRSTWSAPPVEREEFARYNGHADLNRERIDAVTGD
jgi:hypothetical protein